MSVMAVSASDRVMVVAPHQDDESIGCGGTIHHWESSGATVGVTWMSATPDGRAVGAEARDAAELLGLSWTRGMGIHPAGLCDDAETLHGLVAAFREFSPTVLLIPHEDEDDRQHRITTRLAREAEWLAAYPIDEHLSRPIGRRPRLVLGYEVWTPLSRPNTFLDITAAESKKRAAIHCYSSQQEITDFAEAALSLNRYRGVMSGCGRYAEAFQLFRAD